MLPRLSHWLLRFELNRGTMLDKGLTLGAVQKALQVRRRRRRQKRGRGHATVDRTLAPPMPSMCLGLLAATGRSIGDHST